jgi:hypothetical protein
MTTVKQTTIDLCKGMTKVTFTATAKEFPMKHTSRRQMLASLVGLFFTMALIGPAIPAHASSQDRTESIRLLQMDFPFQGPGKDEMNRDFRDLAQSIADYPGVIWKIWTVNEETHEAGGIYLFEDETALNQYVAMHTERLKGFGVTSVTSKIFEIPEVLTKIAGGRLERAGGTPVTSAKPIESMRLLQMDFPFQGPGKDEMNRDFRDLAQSIADYPGVIWKIWTVNEETHEAGGIYLFEDETALNQSVAMHTERLKGFGVTSVTSKTFEIPEILTRICRGPIPR